MSTDFKSQRSETVLTPEMRFAYPFLHEKRTKRANGSPLKTPRYDVVGLLPKLNNDPSQCANYMFLWRLINEAATKSWGSFPQGGYIPIQDGDAPPKPKAPVPGQTAVAPKDYPWRKGHWVFEMTNYLEPGPRVCVMQNGQAVEIPTKVVMGKTMYKSGDYGYASIGAYSFQNEKFGVNLSLEGILWTREGEAIGSSGPKSAQAMFGSVATIGQPAPAPQQYASPAAPAMPSPPTAPAPAPQQYAPAAQGYAPPGPPAGAPLPPMPTAGAPVPGAMPLPPLPGR